MSVWDTHPHAIPEYLFCYNIRGYVELPKDLESVPRGRGDRKQFEIMRNERLPNYIYILRWK